MLRLHLLSFCCLGTIATTHTLECHHDPQASMLQWISAIAYCVLSLIQLLVLLHLSHRHGNSSPDEIPPVA